MCLQVICNGEEVLTTAGTKETYTVEIWSGNHPFYQGADNVQMKEEGRVAAFNRRYAVRPQAVWDMPVLLYCWSCWHAGSVVSTPLLNDPCSLSPGVWLFGCCLWHNWTCIATWLNCQPKLDGLT